MDRQLQRMAAILTTLAELDGAPESTLYLFCDMDMQVWGGMKHMLLTADLIQVTNYYVTLTKKGRKLAEQVEKAIKAAGDGQ